MSKTIFLYILVIVFSVTLISCGSSDKDQLNIAYQAVDETGEAVPELVVVDDGGKELKRIALPEDVYVLVPFRFPSSRFVLYEDAVSTQNWFLVDVAAGTFEEIDTPSRPCGSSTVHVLLCGEEQIRLVNMESGKVSDVPIKADPEPFSIRFLISASPDESHLLLKAASDIWLIPTATPDKSRRLGSENIFVGHVGQVAISNDSKVVFYIVKIEGGEAQVISESIDGSGTEIIYSGFDILGVATVPQKDRLVITSLYAVTIFDLSNQEVSFRFELGDQVQELWVEGEGNVVALSVGGFRVDEVPWGLIDLEKGSVEMLHELIGYRYAHGFLPPNLVTPRWLLLLNDPGPEQTARNVGVAGLDLRTGKVRTFSPLNDVINITMEDATTDGRVGLVSALVGEQKYEVWLFLADQGEAIRVPTTSSGFGFMLSPDGKWLLLGEPKQSGTPPFAQTIKLIATAGDDVRVLGEGLRPVWVLP